MPPSPVSAGVAGVTMAVEMSYHVCALAGQVWPLPGRPALPGSHRSACIDCHEKVGPVCRFPNMTAVSLEDSKGLNYVSTTDFLKVGILGSFMAYGLILTLGYSIMMLIGW